MGIAKAVSDFMRIEKCIPMEQTGDASNAAKLVNEFTEQSLEIMKNSDVNKQRAQKNKKLVSSQTTSPPPAPAITIVPSSSSFLTTLMIFC